MHPDLHSDMCPDMCLEIDVARHHGFTVLTPRGDIDVASSARLKETLTDVLVAGDLDVLVDLAEVEFIDRADKHLLRVFRSTGLDEVLVISGTPAEATAGAPPRC